MQGAELPQSSCLIWRTPGSKTKAWPSIRQEAPRVWPLGFPKATRVFAAHDGRLLFFLNACVTYSSLAGTAARCSFPAPKGESGKRQAGVRQWTFVVADLGIKEYDAGFAVWDALRLAIGHHTAS